MAEHAASFRYAYLGLCLQSSIALPDLPPWQGAIDAAAVVELIEGATPAALDACLFETPLLQVDRQGNALFRLAAIGSFLITGGKRIVFAPAPDVLPGEIATFLLATIGGIVLQQRGFLTLHASAVAIGGRAALISGPSGAGKSTIAGALARRGHALLADDVCGIDMSSGRYMVLPSRTQMKLGPDSLKALDLEAEAGDFVRRGQIKRRVPPPSQQLSATPPAAMFRLQLAGGGAATAAVEPLAGFARITPPEDILFKSRIGDALGHRKRNFEGLSGLAAQIPFYRVTRPHGFDGLDAIVRGIEAAVQGA